MSARIAAYIRQHHLALVCLFLILSGGTAWATHGAPNTISSEDIIDAEVKNPDIAPDSVATGKILDAGVRNPDLGPDSVATGKILDGTVRSSDVADDTTDFGLTAQDLEPGSVGTSEVADNSLTNKDVGGSLEGSNIADASLSGADIGDSTLTGADIGFGTLTGADVATGSLTGSDVADQSLSAVDIANNNSLGGAEIDESDLELPFAANGDFQQFDQCSGVLSKSPEVCARVDVRLLPPFSRVFAVASGGWRKELGDPADSQCSLFVGGEFQDILFMGDKTGFGGGHSSAVHAMPFTLNATTDRLDGGLKAVELICEDNSSDDQDTFIDDVSISALAAG